MTVQASKLALLAKLGSHRVRVPKKEVQAFDRTLEKIKGIATAMDSSVEELMSHVANRLTGKHMSPVVKAEAVNCLHVGHPGHLCPRQRPTCGDETCWCASEFKASAS